MRFSPALKVATAIILGSFAVIVSTAVTALTEKLAENGVAA
ncbi:MAG TPA: hypothetical protein VGH91_06670 [Gammaproteobacteria bacterium]|jgi:hypothetical protein